MLNIRPSTRKQAKIKLALQGCAGSGKTYSALLLAYGMTSDWSKIAVIDSENGSADLYAHLGTYNVVSLGGDYSPENYIEAITLCENAGMEVIIVDSISQCWDYLLDFHAGLQGNSFANWAKVTPRQNAFVQKILQSAVHIICTMRTKQDYVLNEKNGKMVPEKVGLKAMQRDGMDYEFTVVLDIDLKHHVQASKDRTGLFMGRPEFTITPKVGQAILNWCNPNQISFNPKPLKTMETALQLHPVRQEIIPLPTQHPINITQPLRTDKTTPFIEANTKEVSLRHLQSDCVVPVFSKDNEVTISHPAFVETVHEAAQQFFRGEAIDSPEIRVSHIIKGRIPEAIHKPVNQLLETDKTIYYERMMFCFEIPTIHEDIDGNPLKLTVGGVRAYNHENLYNKKSAEKFKVFVGFQNMVCCNMCVSTDGYKSEIKVMNTQALFQAVMELFQLYNPEKHTRQMQTLVNSSMTEHQFAQFLGKSRLYQCLPQEDKKRLPQLLMTDTQINLVARAYYQDEAFGVDAQSREISMWKVYNLLTGANKSSYIDNFLDRALNASQLAEGINKALYGESEYRWFVE